MIILNKCDVAEKSTLSRLEASIRSLNPTAALYQTVRGELDVGKILNLAAYSSSPFFTSTLTNDSDGQPVAHDHDHEDHDHTHSAENQDTLNGISSLVIPFGPLSTTQATKLDQWLRLVLWEGALMPSNSSTGLPSELPSELIDVLRCKGVYSTSEGKTYIIQGVRTLYDIQEEPSGDDRSGGLKVGKLVLIGKLGDKLRIKSSFVSYTGITKTA